MKQFGRIRDFGRYTDQQLEQVKKDLNISMPVSALRFCASYYRSRAKRDPRIDELQLLDALFAKASATASAIAPAKLLTNDTFVAETYADLIEKRRALRPNASAPCSLEEAAQVASMYLARAGKDLMPRNTVLLPEDRTLCRFSATEENCVVPSESHFQLRLLDHAPIEAQHGDWLVLLTPKPNVTTAAYQSAVGDLLSLPAFASHLVRMRTVDEGGLLKAILSILPNGARLELPYLAQEEGVLPLQRLTDGYLGMRLALIRNGSADAVRRMASERGLIATVFGIALPEPMLTVVQTSDASFVWELGFLKSLVHLRSVDAHLANETTDISISQSRSDGSQNRYLAAKEAEADSDIATWKGTLTALTVARPQNSFFLHGLYAALLPIVTLAASGCDYPMQRLTIGLDLPAQADRESVAGECVSSILGLYRAQTELAIPASAVSVRTDPDAMHPEITVFSTATGSTLPSRFVQSESSVFLIRLELRSDGLPNFTSLRETLTVLTHWARKGIVKSARAVCNEPLSDALDSMTKKGLRYKLAESAQEDLRIPFAILLETAEGIPAERVASIEAVSLSAETLEATVSLPDRSPSMIWSEQTEVVLLADAQDIDAQALLTILTKRGANVSSFDPCDPETHGPLSRALLGAHVLLLCKGVQLPDTPSASFARSTMRAAGGICIALGEESTDADIRIENGLNEAALDWICQNPQNL